MLDKYYTYFVFLYRFSIIFMNKVTISNKKHQSLLSAGRVLFWKHGFRRISIDEVCKTAGTSKMTFYRYFPDKLALAKAVFDTEVDNSILQFREIMISETTASEKLEAMLRIKSDSVNNISQEFLNDFYTDKDSDLKTYIAQKTANVWNEIVNDFKLAQQKGVFRSDFKPEILLYISQQLPGFINDPYLVQLCGSPQEVVMEIARFFTYGIAPNAKTTAEK
ncbi:MAG: regulatory protein [Bacteroidetes bacterium]|nr:MAG: regulatory protein [Bacteroidota bacterium]